ncbi:MAG TPA: UDP-N-acetylmuramoyl-tripeptide--D-alanyl-D-alanine ligase [Candidatus Limnocylindria bacterium]|nr:UDP-N-acetylmuramoyl-tripeptide--D-alanyl-D-alanine ligase [Candidatus Limnocylindria bacterium]
MDSRTLEYAMMVVNGEWLAGSPALSFSRVTTDSRDLRVGDLFIALEGERFDGHEFLAEAAAKGAVGAVVQRVPAVSLPPEFTLIKVARTRQALLDLSRRYRADFAFPVICVAGSNGKTTTKEMVAAVLSSSWPTAKSEASHNNDIGVPLTILRWQARHHAAVVEAGTNHPGELQPLLDIIRPTIGVIPSIGREHLEYFGDMEGVLAEEGTLPQSLPPDGTLFINGDLPWADRLASVSRARVVRVGFGERNDWKVRIDATQWERTVFHLKSPDQAWTGLWVLGMPGRHMMLNAALAIAVGARLGADPDRARAALAGFSGARQRLQLSRAGDLWLLDDTYNANADSMLAALQTLCDLPCAGRRVAVLGDMAELGPHAATAHEEVGKSAARLGLDALFTVGRYSNITAAAALGAPMVAAFPDVDAAVPALREYLKAGDAVLAKASRSSRLERVVEALRREFTPSSPP